MPRKPTKKAKKKSPASVRRDGIEISDADKLRLLATWIDMEDLRKGVVGTEVQDDLRRIAKQLDAPTGDEGRKLEEVRKYVQETLLHVGGKATVKPRTFAYIANDILRILNTTPTAKRRRN
jgi:hypothetical protein